MIRLVAMSLIVMIAIVHANPTMYKKNEQNLYEPGEFWSRNKNHFERKMQKICKWCVHVQIEFHPRALQSCSFRFNEITLWSVDLVPVSSTVIPEAEMPNKDEITAEMDQQFKKAFYSLFKKKFNAKLEKPDTLMTDKKKFQKNVEKEVTKSTWNDSFFLF